MIFRETRLCFRLFHAMCFRKNFVKKKLSCSYVLTGWKYFRTTSGYLHHMPMNCHPKLDLYLAGASADKQVEGRIDLLTGFAPTDRATELESFLEKEGLYYLSAPAEGSDDPPIKLKNSWFSSLFEPIGKIVLLLPVYDELDLTPYFAPILYAFLLVFALGDMGYGATAWYLLGLLGRFFLPKG